MRDDQIPGRMGAKETVALLAGLMALNAFAIDAMIPALPQIGADLGVSEENKRQLVVVAYMLGFGSTQLVWGPLADRFGRKPVLAIGVALYTFFAMLCGLASSFTMLIACLVTAILARGFPPLAHATDGTIRPTT